MKVEHLDAKNHYSSLFFAYLKGNKKTIACHIDIWKCDLPRRCRMRKMRIVITIGEPQTTQEIPNRAQEF